MNFNWKSILQALIITMIVWIVSQWLPLYLIATIAAGEALYLLWTRRNNLWASALNSLVLSSLIGVMALVYLGYGPANPGLGLTAHSLAALLIGWAPLFPIPPELTPRDPNAPLIPAEVVNPIPPEAQQNCPNCEAVVARSSEVCEWCGATLVANSEP